MKNKKKIKKRKVNIKQKLAIKKYIDPKSDTFLKKGNSLKAVGYSKGHYKGRMRKIDFGKALTINVDCNLGRLLALQDKSNELVAAYNELNGEMMENNTSLNDIMEWVKNISERIGRMEDEYKRHLYGGSSGLENIMPTGMKGENDG